MVQIVEREISDRRPLALAPPATGCFSPGMGALLDPIDPAVLKRAVDGILRLTPAELRVLGPLLVGQTNAEIGAELGSSRRTVEVHVGRIQERCGCDRRTLIRLGHLLDQERAVAEYIKRMPAYERHPGARKVAKARAEITGK
ncbi:MAG: LuxR C-terminal-related transcriptional regulator [Devosia sp.]